MMATVPTATTTYSATPFGLQQTTTYGAATPTVTYAAPAMAAPTATVTTMQSVNRTIQCMQCAATFTTSAPGNVVRCPYCQFINSIPGTGVATQTTMYSSPTYL